MVYEKENGCHKIQGGYNETMVYNIRKYREK